LSSSWFLNDRRTEHLSARDLATSDAIAIAPWDARLTTAGRPLVQKNEMKKRLFQEQRERKNFNSGFIKLIDKPSFK
jgi:hypothetical protein